MKNVLVAYASKYGSTAQIAKLIGNGIDGNVDVQNVDDITNLDYDLIILGTPLYEDQPLPQMRDFINENQQQLQSAKKAIFVITTEPTNDERDQKNIDLFKNIVPGEVVSEQIFGGEVDMQEVSNEDANYMNQYLSSIGEPKESFQFIEEQECQNFGEKLNQFL